MQDVERLPSIAPVSVTLSSGVRLHGIQTGWIHFKATHYRLDGPENQRFQTILADDVWTSARPLLSWVIEHPDGLIVVDAGERAGANDLGAYLAEADTTGRFFIPRNFRIHVDPGDELGPQLRKLGLSPLDVRWVIQTHLHFDHADGLAFFPSAEVLVSRAEYEGQRRVPQGAVAALWPRDFDPRPLDYPPHPFGSFEQHLPLTAAGDVLLIPTPGHSYGHQSVVVQDSDMTYFLAGDLTFDEGQLQRSEVGGIVLNVPESRISLELARRFVASRPCVFLPSHDPAALMRLALDQATRLQVGP